VGLLDFLKGKGAPPVKGVPASPAGASAENGKAAPAAHEPDLGCLLCGKRLVDGRTQPAACALCGASRSSSSRCAAGHVVCDACRGAEAADVVEQVCAATAERDPAALALRLLQLPALRGPGAEHRFLVPAVLLAAWSNATGLGAARRAELVALARRRSGSVPACGEEGGCGAAAGAGTFVSIAAGAAGASGPDGPSLALAERMAARAASLVGESGSRCCKRDSLLSILAAARFVREHLAIELPAQGTGCERTGRSAECLGSGCPFDR